VQWNFTEAWAWTSSTSARKRAMILRRGEAGLFGMGEVRAIAAPMHLLSGGPGGGAAQFVAPAEVLRLAAVRHVRAMPAPIEQDLGVDRGGAEEERAQDGRAVFAAGRAGHGRELTEDVGAVAAGGSAELDALVKMEAARVELPEKHALMVIPCRAGDRTRGVDDACVGIVRHAAGMAAEELRDAPQDGSDG